MWILCSVLSIAGKDAMESRYIITRLFTPADTIAIKPAMVYLNLPSQVRHSQPSSRVQSSVFPATANVLSHDVSLFSAPFPASRCNLFYLRYSNPTKPKQVLTCVCEQVEYHWFCEYRGSRPCPGRRSAKGGIRKEWQTRWCCQRKQCRCDVYCFCWCRLPRYAV